MVLKIRLARYSKRHNPFYNIVVTHARTARGSKPLEVLGTFDPTPKTPLPTRGDDTPADQQLKQYKDVKLDLDRTRYWLGVGAQPSPPAWKLLGMIGLVVPKLGRRKVLGGSQMEAWTAEQERRVQEHLEAQDGAEEGAQQGVETVKAE